MEPLAHLLVISTWHHCFIHLFIYLFCAHTGTHVCQSLLQLHSHAKLAMTQHHSCRKPRAIEEAGAGAALTEERTGRGIISKNSDYLTVFTGLWKRPLQLARLRALLQIWGKKEGLPGPASQEDSPQSLRSLQWELGDGLKKFHPLKDGFHWSFFPRHGALQAHFAL